MIGGEEPLESDVITRMRDHINLVIARREVARVKNERVATVSN